MTLRPGRVEDALACATVHVRCWQQTYADLAPGVAALDPRDREPRWREELARGSTVVAEVDGAVVGFAVARDGELALLYVDAAAQGRGLGHALHEDAVRRLGPAPLLWVLEGNTRARAFYAAHGWHPTGERQQVDVAGTGLAELRYRLAR